VYIFYEVQVLTNERVVIDRRAEILEAAIRVLARDGIAATTTRKIAAEAGVNQATLRYYFGSKDNLLRDVLREMMRTTQQVVQQGATFEGDIREAIAQSIRAFWSHVEQQAEWQIMQYELTLYALRNPEAAWLAKQQYEGYSELVEALIRQNFEMKQQACAIAYAELARFIVAGLDGIILQFVSDRDQVRAKQDVDNLIKAVIGLAGL
jgi:AcrR family transcriptional regulator